jgi:hypothetical protein
VATLKHRTGFVATTPGSVAGIPLVAMRLGRNLTGRGIGYDQTQIPGRDTIPRRMQAPNRSDEGWT